MQLNDVDILLNLALLAHKARLHTQLLLQTVNVLCVAPEKLALFREHLDKVVGRRWLGLEGLRVKL